MLSQGQDLNMNLSNCKGQRVKVFTFYFYFGQLDTLVPSALKANKFSGPPAFWSPPKFGLVLRTCAPCAATLRTGATGSWTLVLPVRFALRLTNQDQSSSGSVQTGWLVLQHHLCWFLFSCSKWFSLSQLTALQLPTFSPSIFSLTSATLLSAFK